MHARAYSLTYKQNVHFDVTAGAKSHIKIGLLAYKNHQQNLPLYSHKFILPPLRGNSPPPSNFPVFIVTPVCTGQTTFQIFFCIVIEVRRHFQKRDTLGSKLLYM